ADTDGSAGTSTSSIGALGSSTGSTSGDGVDGTSTAGSAERGAGVGTLPSIQPARHSRAASVSVSRMFSPLKPRHSRSALSEALHSKDPLRGLGRDTDHLLSPAPQ